MSIDTAPVSKTVQENTTEHEIMDGVAVHTTSRTLIGRDAELTEIASLLGVRSSSAAPSEAVHVVLSGDAGVGKTRLLVELRDLAVEEEWRVVAGHCLDFGDSALPYLPFSEVLGRLEAELPEVVGRVAEAHPALARLQPGRRMLASAGGPASGRVEGESVDRGDLFTAVHSLLEEAAQVAPVLLVIEDCHWADQSTRDLLSFLFSRPFEGAAEHRVAIVASYRADDLHRRHPLRRQVAEWSRLRGVERLQLGPLGDDQVRLLIDSLSPGAIAEKELSVIVRRAEGNAFFVEELVGAATQPGSWVPDDLADVLLVRLDRLNDASRHVVRVASVAGRKVAHDLLVAASGLSSTELEDGLRQAVEMNLLVPGDGTYSFRHALLGEAVYDDLLPGERVRLHAQYAEALGEGMGRGTAAELARHARLAHDLDTALDASIRAGDEAMAVAGPDEAAHHYEQALELLADPRRRSTCEIDISKLAVSAAEALTASGQPTRAAALLAEQLAGLAPDAPPAWRARMLAARADAVMLTENIDVHPAELVAGGRRPAAGRRRRTAREGAGDPGAGAVRLRPLRRGAGRRARRAGARRAARPARAGLGRDHHAEPAQEGRPQGRAPLGPGRGGAPRGRHRRRPGRAASPLLPGSFLRGLGRVGTGGDMVPQRHEGRRERGDPVCAVRLRVPLAGRVDQVRRRRLGRGAAAGRHQQRAGAADPGRAGRGGSAAGRVRPG